MSNHMEPATTPPLHSGELARTATTVDPGQPRQSGYAEPKPAAARPGGQPNPDAAGNEKSQVAASVPGEEEEEPDGEELPPGEYKREPIKDPDPADTKLHVQQSSR